jgi:hypothetical protein
VLALALGAAATDGRADDDEDQVSQSSFEHAKIIIEFNSTDRDVGIQAFLGRPSGRWSRSSVRTGARSSTWTEGA